MAATAEERISALPRSEDIFSLAVPLAAIASEPRIGANAPEGEKTHQGIFSTNRALYVSAMWPKWSETHQDGGQWWSETVLGIAIDANGNTLSDPSGKSYTWDFENRMVQAVLPGTNGGTTTFKYDPFGRRIQKSGPLGTTNYLYDQRNTLEELDQSGDLLSRYAQDKGIDRPLAELRSGTPSYYQQDGIGSVTSVSNSTGALAATYTYDSFGKQTASTGTLTNPFQYTGRESDSETAIDYYRARYYDPTAGRFVSGDPSEFRGGINFYAYVRNSPITFTDPLGLVFCVKTPLGLVCQGDNNSGTTTVTPAPPGLPPVPPELRHPRPVNICDKGQIALFSEAGPNPYNGDGRGEDRWSDFQDKFIDKCLAAGSPDKPTVPICTQGAGILGPFAYCTCCQSSECPK